ncbi:hypothetical protein Tco_0430024, partial [Tanacetum coccineum]
MTNNLMAKKLKGYAMKNAKNKRMFDNIQKDNGGHQPRVKGHVLGEGDANPDSNVVTGTFLLKNHYASVLLNSGADRSLDIISVTLDVSYAVELADERVSKTNTILRG